LRAVGHLGFGHTPCRAPDRRKIHGNRQLAALALVQTLALRADAGYGFDPVSEPRAGTARRGLARQARSVRHLRKGKAVLPSLFSRRFTRAPQRTSEAEAAAKGKSRPAARLRAF
jgi:hypothetical protein